jgi:hypothetical protein
VAVSAAGSYVSRNALATADAQRRAEILRANKRAIAADVLREMLAKAEGNEPYLASCLRVVAANLDAAVTP